MDNLTIDDFLELQIDEGRKFLDNNIFPLQNKYDDMLKDFEKYGKLLLKSNKSNNYGPVIKFINSANFIERFGTHKENSCPNIENNNDKKNETADSLLVKVKKEKLSISSNASVQSIRDDADTMPAPKMPPPKTRRVKKEKASLAKKVKQEIIPQEDISEGTKRVTRSKVDRTSDVILENPVVPVIDLSDSVDKIEELPIRSTRTRTKKKAESTSVENTKTKNASDTKENTELSEPPVRTTRTKRKRSKSNSTTDEPLHKDASCIGAGNEAITNISAHTEYEDAVSQFENRPNATFIVSMESDSNEEQIKLGGQMNETVVIDPSKNQEIAMSNTNDLITDDESIEEQETAIVKQQKIKKDNSYENSPVKKKVEVFENLQKNKNITTSKLNASNILRELEGNKGNVKEKAKGFFAKNSIGVTKTNPSSASKIGKYIGHKNSMLNSSVSVNKSTTPQSCHTLKERELRQAMTEERKKKYEEKVKRVLQHQKETMEKEKEKALELQRIKEERYKMVLQQKEEKQRLLKEENERKRQLAKQRAEEKRKEEEALRIAAQEKKEQKRKIEGDIPKKFGEMIPIYMHQPTPPLPCYDCYDSDDERYTERKNIPVWASKTNVRKWDYIQMGIGHKIKNTMFCCHSQNIDLKEVFQRIDPKKLKRTSSANWEKPPRFTLLPATSETD